MKRDYFEGADVAVAICAKDGTILDMNAKSRLHGTVHRLAGSYSKQSKKTQVRIIHPAILRAPCGNTIYLAGPHLRWIGDTMASGTLL